MSEIDRIDIKDIPDSVLLKYCIRDYHREKKMRIKAESDLQEIKRTLDVMNSMYENVMNPTQQQINEKVGKKITVYKKEITRLNEVVAKLRTENDDLVSRNNELRDELL